MWTATKSEAVEMFARFWAARYGTTASGSARKTADVLAQRGDLEGNEMWNKVADAIDRHQQAKRPA